MSQKKTNSKRTRRNWTHEDKVRILARLEIHNGNIKRTARENGMPPSTLRKWRDEELENPNPVTQEILNKTVDMFKAETEDIIHLTLSLAKKGLIQRQSDDKDITLREVKDLLTSMAITYDKLNLHEGKPTARVESSNQINTEEIKEVFLESFSEAIQQSQDISKDVLEIKAEIESYEEKDIIDLAQLPENTTTTEGE